MALCLIIRLTSVDHHNALTGKTLVALNSELQPAEKQLQRLT